MHRLFMPLDEEVSCRLTESGKMVLDIAHLIDRKYVERYQNKFATTSAMMRECQLQLSGPWPPYHFVHRLTRSAHAQAQPAAAQPARSARSLGDSSHGIDPRAGLTTVRNSPNSKSPIHRGWGFAFALCLSGGTCRARA